MSPDMGIHRILVIGELDAGSTSRSRLEAFRQLGHDVREVALAPWISQLPLGRHLLTHYLYAGPNIARLNARVLEAAAAFRPDFVWVEKSRHLSPATVRALRTHAGRLLQFSGDNQMIRANQSPWYLATIPLYDAHVTTKPHNEAWLRQRGARRVIQMIEGFDPALHRPLALTADERGRYGCDIGFVGHYEPSRETRLLELHARGYGVKVWGGNWRRARHRRHPLFAGARHLVADEYVKALCGAKINLCLLSQWFGDVRTTRSVEVPACGQFLLGERTEAHQSLFREGVEAEWYDTPEELHRKIAQYLTHEADRLAIGQAGRRRCLQGYGYPERLREVLQQVAEAA